MASWVIPTGPSIWFAPVIWSLIIVLTPHLVVMTRHCNYLSYASHASEVIFPPRKSSRPQSPRYHQIEPQLSDLEINLQSVNLKFQDQGVRSQHILPLIRYTFFSTPSGAIIPLVIFHENCLIPASRETWSSGWSANFRSLLGPARIEDVDSIVFDSWNRACHGRYKIKKIANNRINRHAVKIFGTFRSRRYFWKVALSCVMNGVPTSSSSWRRGSSMSDIETSEKGPSFQDIDL